jgi:hypothetical protein
MSMVASQNALSTTAEVVLTANQNRTYAEVKNNDGAIVIYLGHDSGVTSSTGYPLAAGATFGFSNMGDAVYAIAASGTPTLAVIEWSR